MAFCSTCGASVGDAARFCTGCGTPQVAAASPAGGVTPLDFNIEGDNLQIARLHLKPGEEVYGEAGRMVYKTSNVYWDTRMSGESIGEKLLGAFRRKISGESLFLTYFHSNGAGEVGFAGAYPGKIQAFDLAPGQSIIAQRDSFLCAQTTVTFGIAFVKKLGAGFFGGEGFILEKFTGPGLVFLHAGGDFIQFNLAPRESLQIETGCIVAFDESVDYDIQFAGGIKTAVFGGEGLFLANVTGPGRIIVQSMTLQKMRRELSLALHGSDDRRGLSALNIFGDNND